MGKLTKPIKYVSVKEAANMLSVSASTVRRWTNDGKLVSARTDGGHRRIDFVSILSMMKRLGIPYADYLTDQVSGINYK